MDIGHIMGSCWMSKINRTASNVEQNDEVLLDLSTKAYPSSHDRHSFMGRIGHSSFRLAAMCAH